jgi:hypothetical protein
MAAVVDKGQLQLTDARIREIKADRMLHAVIDHPERFTPSPHVAVLVSFDVVSAASFK